jgi:hypothetical protein
MRKSFKKTQRRCASRGWRKYEKARGYLSYGAARREAEKESGSRGVSSWLSGVRRWQKRKYASNGRRRRARFSYNGRRRRSRNYSHWLPAYANNPSWIPSYARNPGMVGTLTKGFSPSMIISTLPVIGGALGNAAFAGFLGNYMPSILRSGVGNLALGAASAGLLGAGVGMLAPRYAGPVFFGGIIEVMTRVIRQYAMPLIGKGVSTVKGMLGMGDYLSRSDAAGARPLGYFNMWQQSPSLGDYLSRSDAAGARPLGYFNMWQQSPALGHCPETGSGAAAISEELVTGDYAPEEIMQGDYMQDAPLMPTDQVIEGTAENELTMS